MTTATLINPKVQRLDPRKDNFSRGVLLVLSVLALGLFAWPLLAGGAGVSSPIAMTVALVGVPVLVVLGTFLLEGSLRDTTVLALVAVLVALAATARVLSTGIGGFELIFVVVILAGRALGSRLGFIIGVLAIALSSLVWGGFGPWTAFQMLGVGWVAAGAGLLPRWQPKTRGSRRLEVALLASYGVLASYAFGLLMNLWFWPIAVGAGTTVSFVDGASFGENATRFVVYSLASSTLTWDTVRAITTAGGLLLVGSASLVALRRAHTRF
jgi:energy-coupling factor transport system substrate-specific component